MELQLQIKMNEKLFLRNPEETVLGKKIIQQSIILIHQIGFEAFTFKKLAAEIGTTEAGVYRYFENKHLLLIYIVDWYWSWQEYQLLFHTNNIAEPATKLKIAIMLLAKPVISEVLAAPINEGLLCEIVMSEGAKSYLTKHVTAYNEMQLFKPYKNFCGQIANIIQEYNPTYKFPHSLASTIIEMAHSQNFYMKNLPSLTDFSNSKDEIQIAVFLEDMVFSTIRVH